jgi:hypothetical protein
MHEVAAGGVSAEWMQREAQCLDLFSCHQAGSCVRNFFPWDTLVLIVVVTNCTICTHLMTLHHQAKGRHDFPEVVCWQLSCHQCTCLLTSNLIIQRELTCVVVMLQGYKIGTCVSSCRCGNWPAVDLNWAMCFSAYFCSFSMSPCLCIMPGCLDVFIDGFLLGMH